MFKIMITSRLKLPSLIFFLFVAPALAGAENKPQASDQVPQVAPQITRPSQQAARSEDYFAGLTLSVEQQAKVDQIHKDIISRMDIVARDPAENEDQKGAMLLGLARMERSQIYQVLTPVQQAEVRKKIAARREAEKEQSKARSLPR